jgi:hypothetical protein
MTHTAEAAKPFGKTVRQFGNALGGFNSFLNTLAYKPKNRESYLFYLPWVNHNLNATFGLQDAGGPILRGVIFISCNGSRLGVDGLAGGKPYLRTLIQLARIPSSRELPEIPGVKQEGTTIEGCGPNTK